MYVYRFFLRLGATKSKGQFSDVWAQLEQTHQFVFSSLPTSEL